MESELISSVREILGQSCDAFRSKLLEVAELERLQRKQLLTPGEVFALYGFPVATQETWRCRGGGPDYVKVGASVYYTHDAIKRFLADRRVLGHA
ncbi:hypothetical protein NNJEOMEG_03286 [Fundidesulfovibrio magnetotacticus]|uniref:Helix-turn-helix domain-containing protein n=1 Tax=Fundidesulfovibrio magnetotacticus TaxID=2730080 RepID=A0A6V8LSH2_9BACT|nr:hypothetical protein [Fundidesulfovibrio magnetotacticus]GFK95423.1 hypothetical protein NNJEOMEG_03286 [Fundidesulfovibrio magnetotacticus]